MPDRISSRNEFAPSSREDVTSYQSRNNQKQNNFDSLDFSKVHRCDSIAKRSKFTFSSQTNMLHYHRLKTNLEKIPGGKGGVDSCFFLARPDRVSRGFVGVSDLEFFQLLLLHFLRSFFEPKMLGIVVLRSALYENRRHHDYLKVIILTWHGGCLSAAPEVSSSLSITSRS